MKYHYSRQDMRTLEDAQANAFLLTNGLGGYCSVTGAFSAPRADQGLLVAAVKAPNERINMVHRLQEEVQLGSRTAFLSSQQFADGTPTEEGWQLNQHFTVEYGPIWDYSFHGMKLRRRCAMARFSNTAAVLYDIENPTDAPCTLTLTPWFKFAPKEAALEAPLAMTAKEAAVFCSGYTLYIKTNGSLSPQQPRWQTLSYPEDAKDGRADRGMAGSCCRITFSVQPGSTDTLELVFSTEDKPWSARQLLEEQSEYLRQLEDNCDFTDATARQLALSADAYIARRDSTGGKTILAGYPLFSDWGRDTMIALPGCTLATGRYEDARSILRTFLAYEKDGLVPNLFPEGTAQPMYNTVDAALLLIDCIWQYLGSTQDLDFVKEAWPVMERIIAAYRTGTHHAIGMDTDGLIFAGAGLDQVTWMDVCVQGVLPTPRHGKPVEINAYWYNALKIMEALAPRMGLDGTGYGDLAALVKASFLEKFYIPEKGYLRDVLSGTDADEQLRCNQVWALSMPFTMLAPQQERQVLEAVEKHLLTACGLRTLSPADPQYHPHYGGSQYHRDMAYHQGTTWVFPMGAYYRAYLRIHGSTKEAAAEVKRQLGRLDGMLRQGCAGQLPEIYDGSDPYEGKGCFAQAWSVGEMLRVYEDIQKIERQEV